MGAVRVIAVLADGRRFSRRPAADDSEATTGETARWRHRYAIPVRILIATSTAGQNCGGPRRRFTAPTIAPATTSPH